MLGAFYLLLKCDFPRVRPSVQSSEEIENTAKQTAESQPSPASSNNLFDLSHTFNLPDLNFSLWWVVGPLLGEESSYVHIQGIRG